MNELKVFTKSQKQQSTERGWLPTLIGYCCAFMGAICLGVGMISVFELIKSTICS